MNMFYASSGITPDGSFAFTLTVVIAGLSIVLGTLAMLILVFSVFGRLTSRSEAKKQKGNNKTVPEPPEIKKVSSPPPPPPIIESGVSPEIVAVISAAVEAYGEDGAKITSIKRKNSRKSSVNAWAQAAAFDNTRPF